MVRTFLAGWHIPADVDAVRDDRGAIWHRGDDGKFHTLDNRHHRTAAELSARTNLTESRSDGSDGKTVELGLAV